MRANQPEAIQSHKLSQFKVTNPDKFYHGDFQSTILCQNKKLDYRSSSDYAGVVGTAADHPMHASSSSTVGLYGGGRVPPPHPFLRSSSVPEQPSIYDPFLEEDGLIPDFHNHYPPTYRAAPIGGPIQTPNSPLYYESEVLRNPYQNSASGGGNRFGLGGLGAPVGGGWRSSSYLDRDSSARAHRLGRQFSVSSELPTSDDRTNSGPYGKYINAYGGSGLTSGGDFRYGRSNVVASSASANIYGSRTTTTANSRGNPLTLGRSLQLVTSGSSYGGGGPSGSALAGGDPSRRKKTVRFNSEEWGTNNEPSNVHPSLNNPYLNCDDFEDEQDLWMTIEDVRCGRWARWDALRQESQESQTRDSGIETGSCFTSSEDSNRGDHVHKKVESLKFKLTPHPCTSNLRLINKSA